MFILTVRLRHIAYPLSLRIITERGCSYPNIFVRKKEDTYSSKHEKSFGFKTTSITRPLILGNLQEIVKDEITGKERGTLNVENKVEDVTQALH